MIKAIFFDIDGTLLSHTTRSVPYSTQIALQHLKDCLLYTSCNRTNNRINNICLIMQATNPRFNNTII